MAVDYSVVLTAIVNQLPALVTSAATLLGVYLGYRKISQNQEKAANTASVRAVSDAANDLKVDTKLSSIHGMVNSVHGTSLRLAATLAQRLANVTNSPGDIDVAIATKKAADEHDAQQAAQDLKV
jgi:hypothetical protein